MKGGAFSDCSSLQSIVIPNSVTEFGESAFHGCSSLQSIEISDNVTEVGESAFSDCTSLQPQPIEIPNSVTTIESLAFRNALTSLGTVVKC